MRTASTWLILLTLLLLMLAVVRNAHGATPDDPVACLTDNIYYEAGTESDAGKIAVAQVTMNRAEGRPEEVCSVVYQRHTAAGKKIAAFSWTLGRAWRSSGPINPSTYSECRLIAIAILYGSLRSSLIGPHVMWYHADYIAPRWHRRFVVRIGHHLFYRE